MKESRSAVRLPMLLAALLLALPAQAETDDCAGAPCAGAPVQEESPFLWFGMPLSDPASDIVPKVHVIYDPLIRKFPNAASCLQDRQVPPDILDARIDWNAIETREEAEVCLFRLFARIGSLDGIILWFDRNGFDRPFLYVGGGYAEEPYILVSATYDTDQNGLLYGDSFFKSALEKSFTVAVKWNSALMGTTITEQSIWSK